jgi:hypothetical protein
MTENTVTSYPDGRVSASLGVLSGSVLPVGTLDGLNVVPPVPPWTTYRVELRAPTNVPYHYGVYMSLFGTSVVVVTGVANPVTQRTTVLVYRGYLWLPTVGTVVVRW